MKTLYNEYNAAVGDDADELRHITEAFCTSIMKNFIARGYNPREVAHLIIGHIQTVEAEIVLSNAMAKRRDERALDKPKEGVV